MEYKSGQKVIYENKTYDFGYYSATEGKVIIYEEGEMNMQDSYAVDIEKIKPAYEGRGFIHKF